MKNKLCKCDYQPKNKPILKLQSNRATLRSAPTQTAGYTVKSSDFFAALFFIGILKADKPRELEGRALVSRQAANLSSKEIANCEYASSQSLTGIVHFFEISTMLI